MRPPFKDFPNLKGENILLRQIETADITDEMVPITYYDSKPAKNIAEAIAMHEKSTQDYENGNSILWGIEDITTHQIIGCCGYYRGFDNDTGEIGCVMLPQFQGKGIMKNALLLIITFGMDILLLQRIIAITTTPNIKAINLLHRLNFVKTKDLEGENIEFEIE